MNSLPEISPSYSADLLQRDRPQPMYDKHIHRTFRKIFLDHPGDNLNLAAEFKEEFLKWLEGDSLNSLTGYTEGWETDICIGCTHYLDDLYQTLGREKIMVLEGDYRYHWRLQNDRKFQTLESLEAGKQLILSLPFPGIGDIHPQMNEILERCLELGVPVHLDSAWLSCSRGISFDFSHPAIQSFAISLSKGLGTGGHRIGLRFVRSREAGPISIMNDFAMNCQSLMQVGLVFMRELGPNYLWLKYGEAYEKVCRDFKLTPTKAIHVAMDENGIVGVRPLLRYLNDH